ncbi:hypothetical protein GCM10009548_02140 [Streptomyces malaysiensis subsp. malaysiensis]|uniref:Uncharacterized protein n=1 Tax=Streptomyces malaysiensis TaxID=92644 RepID=A0ABX6W4D8_STRMQ|nr:MULTISPECIES: hypothetical protein [Streptomyces]QPI56323.1 hypothetical protein I1A49_16480 [Streptomyces solisilvae]UHH17808.1 hypothetical protein LUV23_16595 [Streptomyces sp. HNM0561]
MIEITSEQLEATLREVADERPDYVYMAPADTDLCSYVHDDGNGVQIPGCIVGHALFRLGVPLAALSQREGLGAADVIGATTNLCWSDPAALAAETAQTAQDDGTPWARAMRLAFPEPS